MNQIDFGNWNVCKLFLGFVMSPQNVIDVWSNGIQTDYIIANWIDQDGSVWNVIEIYYTR